MLVSMTDTTAGQAVESRLIPEILRQAVSSRAPVRLRYGSTTAGTIIRGAVVGQEGETLLVRIHDGEPGAAEHPEVELSAIATVHGVEYEFPTTRVPNNLREPGTMSLAVPKHLFVHERRRSPRRTLQRSLSVQLTPRKSADPAPVDAEESMSAVILNMSPHGLACRLPASQATRLSVDGRLFVSFALGAGNQSFDFTGRIVSITEGGTPERVVLGIEFIDGGTSRAQNALSEALAGGIDA